jgi:hypothetical protein
MLSLAYDLRSDTRILVYNFVQCVALQGVVLCLWKSSCVCVTVCVEYRDVCVQVYL